jgi:hypothetical protein
MVMKQDWGAVATYGERNYEALPKSVLALVAYYMAERITGPGGRDEILAAIFEEWAILHDNGIVPQKAATMETRGAEAVRLRGYAKKADGAHKDWLLARAVTLEQ